MWFIFSSDTTNISFRVPVKLIVTTFSRLFATTSQSNGISSHFGPVWTKMGEHYGPSERGLPLIHVFVSFAHFYMNFNTFEFATFRIFPLPVDERPQMSLYNGFCENYLCCCAYSETSIWYKSYSQLFTHPRNRSCRNDLVVATKKSPLYEATFSVLYFSQISTKQLNSCFMIDLNWKSII